MKRTLLYMMVLSIMLSLPGCAKKGGNTPLEEAYNAVCSAKRKVSGFDKDCIRYNSAQDLLEIYAKPDLDYAAMIGIIEKTVAGREVNAIALHNAGGPAEPLLETFLLNFTAPVKRLELPYPKLEYEGKAGGSHVEQPQLWQDCLERLDNVAEVTLNGGRGQICDYTYLYDIAESGTIRIPCVVIVRPNDDGINLAGLEAVSDLKRLVIGKHRVYSAYRMESERIYGFERLDAGMTQVDLSCYCGTIEAAKLADKLRTMGFTVTGISDDPRDDLDEQEAAKYDSIIAERQYSEALAKDDMPFDERLDGYLSLSGEISSDMRIETGISLLKSFYALEGTAEFTRALERMCSYDPDHCTGRDADKENSLHEHILKRVCQGLVSSGKFERFLTEVAGALPSNGSWCKTELSLTDKNSEIFETTALFALMAGYDRLMEHAGNITRILEDDQISTLCDFLNDRDLLCGYFNSRYLTGDLERDIETAKRLLETGRLKDSQAYLLVFGEVGDGLDTFLHTTVLWDEAFGQMEVRKNLTGEKSLSTDDGRFDIIHYAKPHTDSHVDYDRMTMGEKVLFAYLPRESETLFFPKDAYRWFSDDYGEIFRAIPPQNTPDSADEAELIIIAWTSYQYKGDYTDGTNG
ncbi:MAG: hypothetical protein IJT00_05545, partial [Lachnospiraceae bacterium]|nr:hypothetical protein [Lachnospiraceae bacterium]